MTPIDIQPIHGVIEAIRITVVPQHTLSGGQQDVGRDKPAGGWIVVATLQVIEAGFPIIHISTIAERLEETKRARKRACRCHLLSPRIICVFYYRRSIAVNQLHNIALRIAQIVVFSPVPIDGYYSL